MSDVMQYARELFYDEPRVLALIVLWFVSHFCVLAGAAILKPVIGYWNAIRVMDIASYIWIGVAALIIIVMIIAVVFK